MRISIDVGYDENTIATVSSFMRKLEIIIATNQNSSIVEMGCKDDAGNNGISLILIPNEEPTTNEETPNETTKPADESDEVIEVGEPDEVAR